ESLRGGVPLHNRPVQAKRPRRWDDARLPPSLRRAWAGTSASFLERYDSRKTTPDEIVRRTLEAARELAGKSPPMGALMEIAEDAIADGEASGDRFRAGAPRGPLEGTCFAVKEQTAVAGLPLRVGTRFRPSTPKTTDATIVKRLRQAGAIVVGQTPMTE